MKPINEIQFSNAEFIPEIVRLLKEGHTVTLNLKGFSMRPFLEDNRDKALLTKPLNPKVGDAVLAEIEPGHFIGKGKESDTDVLPDGRRITKHSFWMPKKFLKEVLDGKWD